MRYAERTLEGRPRILGAWYETQPWFEYVSKALDRGPDESRDACQCRRYRRRKDGSRLADRDSRLIPAAHSPRPRVKVVEEARHRCSIWEGARESQVAGDATAPLRSPMGSVWSTAWDGAEEAPLVNPDVPGMSALGNPSH
ncbi:hypothetical protein MTO96_014323 [Rhipicephalus appendiculatus]